MGRCPSPARAVCVPLFMQGLDSNVLYLKIPAGIFTALGIILIVIDLTNNEKIIKFLLGIDE